MTTIDYMVATSGPYSASAAGGNGFSRDFLAGISTMYATPMYTDIGGRLHLQKYSKPEECLGLLTDEERNKLEPFVRSKLEQAKKRTLDKHQTVDEIINA
ncbi:hypothetical protein FQN52_008427 [Onygenales sp. PD_12]|nr:hypothetical protein FQN52_008427 [Onygenales sp. PD_12]